MESYNNAVRVKPDDPEGVEALARYVSRAPLSLQKLSHDPATGEILYHSKFLSLSSAYRQYACVGLGQSR